MTEPGEYPIPDIAQLDKKISEVMLTCKMKDILTGWLGGDAPDRDTEVQIARYVGEKIIEHEIDWIDTRDV